MAPARKRLQGRGGGNQTRPEALGRRPYPGGWLLAGTILEAGARRPSPSPAADKGAPPRKGRVEVPGPLRPGRLRGLLAFVAVVLREGGRRKLRSLTPGGPGTGKPGLQAGLGGRTAKRPLSAARTQLGRRRRRGCGRREAPASAHLDPETAALRSRRLLAPWAGRSAGLRTAKPGTAQPSGAPLPGGGDLGTLDRARLPRAEFDAPKEGASMEEFLLLLRFQS